MGATLKQYDDDWFGSAVTVVEMDGEIDMDNMAALALAALCLLAQFAFLAPQTPTLSQRRGQSSLVAMRGGANSVPTGLVYPSPEEAEKTREVDGLKLYSTHA